MPTNTAETESAAATKPLGPVAVPELLHTKDNPYLSLLVEKRNLTHAASSKRTVHLEFDIADAPLRYEVGDGCGVAPENCPALVDEALDLLRFTGEESVELGGAGSTLGDALRHQLTITRVTRTMVSRCAELGDIGALRELLQAGNQTALDEFVHGRDLVDLVRHYPGVIPKAGRSGKDAAPACQTALLHFVEPGGASRAGPHDDLGRPLSCARAGTRRRLLDASLRSHRARRPPSDLHPAQQEIPPPR
jgi:sulfite reductase alpha subunit-like flavoprotein